MLVSALDGMLAGASSDGIQDVEDIRCSGVETRRNLVAMNALAFTIEVPMTEVVHATAQEYRDALHEALVRSVADSSLTAQISASCTCFMVAYSVSYVVLVGQYPTHFPTTSPTAGLAASSGALAASTNAASATFVGVALGILLCVLGAVAVLVGRSKEKGEMERGSPKKEVQEGEHESSEVGWEDRGSLDDGGGDDDGGDDNDIHFTNFLGTSLDFNDKTLQPSPSHVSLPLDDDGDGLHLNSPPLNGVVRPQETPAASNFKGAPPHRLPQSLDMRATIKETMGEGQAADATRIDDEGATEAMDNELSHPADTAPSGRRARPPPRELFPRSHSRYAYAPATSGPNAATETTEGERREGRCRPPRPPQRRKEAGAENNDTQPHAHSPTTASSAAGLMANLESVHPGLFPGDAARMVVPSIKKAERAAAPIMPETSPASIPTVGTVSAAEEDEEVRWSWESETRRSPMEKAVDAGSDEDEDFADAFEINFAGMEDTAVVSPPRPRGPFSEGPSPVPLETTENEPLTLEELTGGISLDD